MCEECGGVTVWACGVGGMGVCGDVGVWGMW